MLKDDTLANVLYVDLSQKQFRVERRQDLFDKYMGALVSAYSFSAKSARRGAMPSAVGVLDEKYVRQIIAKKQGKPQK